MITLTGLALTGCGAAKLTPAEESTVATANQAFASTALDSSMFRETLQGVDDIIALYRAKPAAKYDDQSMRDVIKDAASTLEQSNPDLSRRLDRELK